MQNDRQSSETVILGVDTHLDIHVGAVISQAGKLLGTHIIQTNQAGYLELLDWARSFGILKLCVAIRARESMSTDELVKGYRLKRS
nr:hypothetical protein [Escherichia albertii]